MAKREPLTAEYVRSILEYHPDTGAFTWRVSRRCVRIGSPAGKTCDRGYRYIKISQRTYLAHRLAWLYITDKWPANEIDHIDGDPSNNRFSNLREATRSENNCNTGARKNNSSGFKGVSFCNRSKKWRANISLNGKNISLGYHQNLDAARAAYEKASNKLHGKFSRTGGG
jgi:hypothetical protein